MISKFTLPILLVIVVLIAATGILLANKTKNKPEYLHFSVESEHPQISAPKIQNLEALETFAEQVHVKDINVIRTSQTTAMAIDKPESIIFILTDKPQYHIPIYVQENYISESTGYNFDSSSKTIKIYLFISPERRVTPGFADEINKELLRSLYLIRVGSNLSPKNADPSQYINKFTSDYDQNVGEVKTVFSL